MRDSKSSRPDSDYDRITPTRTPPASVRLSLVVALCVVALAPEPRWNQQAHLHAGDPAAEDLFGGSVAISGDTLVAGAYQAQVGAYSEAGSAYVFTRTGGTWSQQTKLVADDGLSGDWFGTSVAVSGDMLAVGAHLDDTVAGDWAGSVYMFKRSGGVWSPDGHLYAGSAVEGEQFGHGLGMSGDTMVVGARFGDASGGASDAGTAYVFRRGATNWTQQDQIFASDAGTNDKFGEDAAISGEMLVVGAPGWDSPTENAAGAAYVFIRAGTSWLEMDQLLADDGAAGDQFGMVVDISGDLIVIGAQQDDTAAGEVAGSAYVFSRDGMTWNQEAHLFAHDADAYDIFGSDVAIAGDTILVGAAGNSIPPAGATGSVYVFTRVGTSWVQQDLFTADDAEGGDWFGKKVALDGDTAVVGVPDDNTPAGNEAGSTYVFVLSLLDFFVGEPPVLTLVPGRR